MKYYKSSLQTRFTSSQPAIASSISILQKYSSNATKLMVINLPLVISILQKYSSNQNRAERCAPFRDNFNTTKVLFKLRLLTSAIVIHVSFQYYKSTLQTVLRKTGTCWVNLFQYYKSTLQTCGRGNRGMSRCLISILQKYSSNWCG